MAMMTQTQTQESTMYFDQATSMYYVPMIVACENEVAWCGEQQYDMASQMQMAMQMAGAQAQWAGAGGYSAPKKWDNQWGSSKKWDSWDSSKKWESSWKSGWKSWEERQAEAKAGKDEPSGATSPSEETDVADLSEEGAPGSAAEVALCHECGGRFSEDAGDVDPMDGKWYCDVCWKAEEAREEAEEATKGGKAEAETSEDESTGPSDNNEDESSDTDSASHSGSDLKRSFSSSTCTSSRKESYAAPVQMGLVPSPTSWSAQMRLRREAALASAAAAEETIAPAEMARSVRSLLNKLTGERFESICAQVLDLPLRTEEHLAVLSFEIFDKATSQGGFCSLYTKLVERLDSFLAAQDDGCIGGKAFRRALLSECQSSFERNLNESVDADAFTGLEGEARYELEVKLKQRRLGNMQFIGELIVRKLLATKLIVPVASELIDKGTEASLESVVALLRVVGPYVMESAPMYAAFLEDAFNTLKRKSIDKSVSMFVRCHIRDLLDARRAH